jgi:hypothetical protein
MQFWIKILLKKSLYGETSETYYFKVILHVNK